MSLAPPTTVGKLQETLHAKAKGSASYRFYALYDKVYRADVLGHAYRICQSNGGADDERRPPQAQAEHFAAQRGRGVLALGVTAVDKLLSASSKTQEMPSSGTV